MEDADEPVGELATPAPVLLVATGTAAYASVWSFQEGFEGCPAATWHIEHYGSSNGGFDINVGTARSGLNDAWLSAQDQFSAVGTLVHITAAEVHSPQCGFGIYVAALGTARINLEVIDPAT